MASSSVLPEIVVFGASMVEWSFMEETEGLGWRLTNAYAGKAHVLNEGRQTNHSHWVPTLRSHLLKRASVGMQANRINRASRVLTNLPKVATVDIFGINDNLATHPRASRVISIASSSAPRLPAPPLPCYSPSSSVRTTPASLPVPSMFPGRNSKPISGPSWRRF